ncbi:hypothetical protein ABTE84_20175, partial [Acinetobacter baumannii]
MTSGSPRVLMVYRCAKSPAPIATRGASSAHPPRRPSPEVPLQGLRSLAQQHASVQHPRRAAT